MFLYHGLKVSRVRILKYEAYSKRGICHFQVDKLQKMPSRHQTGNTVYYTRNTIMIK